MGKKYLCLVLSMIVCFLSLLTEKPAGAGEIQITDSPNWQYYPSIDGDRMIWADSIDGSNWDVVMYDLTIGTQTQVSISSVPYVIVPAISGNRIVWQGSDDILSGNADIYMYDILTDTITPITANPEYQGNPDISGSRIVWEDHTINSSIHMYDLTTGIETQITPDAYFQTEPAISEDIIVWQDNSGGNLNIYAYNIVTGIETQITSGPAHEINPDISGNTIVWMACDNSNDCNTSDGQWDIYAYSISTGELHAIATGPSAQMNPAISGNKVVWHDNRNGNWDIYMYDLSSGTERQMTDNPDWQMNPAVSGDRIVWQDNRSPETSSWEIFMYVLSSTISATAGSNGSIMPFGDIEIPDGGSQTFTITPDAGYRVADVVVDGISHGPRMSYYFGDVSEDHTIIASFESDIYSVTATVSGGGTINPAGVLTVNGGDSLIFFITPDAGYELNRVVVDGFNVGTPTSYTLTNISWNRFIKAYFTLIPTPPPTQFTITAEVRGSGTISPVGVSTVDAEGEIGYTITPDPGNQVSRVIVDGMNMGAITSYTFSNVTFNHYIRAYFILQ